MNKGRNNSPEQDPSTDSSLYDLNTRLDRISSDIHPLAPFLLTIPSESPIEFVSDQQRSFWIRGTLFQPEEGQLQYISNFKDWNTSIIHPIGGWDDGKGGIAEETHLSNNLPAAMQQAPKRIKLGDYTKKKAASKLKEGTNDTPLRDNQLGDITYDTYEKSLRAAKIGSSPFRKPSDLIIHNSGQKNSITSPTQKSRESLLPVDDLPPPLTPLPPHLAAAVAQFRLHLASNDIDRAKNPQSPPLASLAFEKYCRLQDAATSHYQQRGHRGVLILKFHDNRERFSRLVEQLTSVDCDEILKMASLDAKAVIKLRDLGLDLIAQTESSWKTRENPIIHMEGLMCIFVYTALSTRYKSNNRGEWTRAMKLLSQFAKTYFSDESSIGEPRPSSSMEVSITEQDLLCHLVDSLMSIIHRELARCEANRSRDRSEHNRLAAWANSEALQYALKASRSFSPKDIHSAYARVWEDSSSFREDDDDNNNLDWTQIVLKGHYAFPLANGQLLWAIRGSRRLILRYCHDAGIDAPDHLGAFAAKQDAAF